MPQQRTEGTHHPFGSPQGRDHLSADDKRGQSREHYMKPQEQAVLGAADREGRKGQKQAKQQNREEQDHNLLLLGARGKISPCFS